MAIKHVDECYASLLKFMNYQRPHSLAIIHVELHDLIRLFPSFYNLPLFSLCQI